MNTREALVARPAGPRAPGANGGFSLVELTTAVVILAVGVIGMGGAAGWTMRQVTMADVTLERTAARQGIVERIKSSDFDSIAAGSDSVGNFHVVWTITQSSSAYKTAQVVTTGPGLGPGHAGTLPALMAGVTDTLDVRVLGRAF